MIRQSTNSTFSVLATGRAHWRPNAMLALVGKVLLAIILLELPINIDKSFFHMERYSDLGATGGLNFSVTTLLLPILIAIWWFESLTARRWEKPQVLLSFSFLAFTIFCIASIFWAHDTSLAIYQAFLITQCFILFAYMANRLTINDVPWVVACLLAGVFFEGLIMILARFTGGFNLMFIDTSVDDQSRVWGTVGHPNATAGYFVFLLPLALAVWSGQYANRFRWTAMLVFVVGLGGLVMTGSRGGWLGFLFSMVLFVGISAYRGRVRAALPLLITGGVALVGAVLFSMISERVAGDDEGAAASRLPLIRVAGDMIGESPLVGHGINNASYLLYWKYQNLSENRGLWLAVVHNKYFEVTVELGFIGLALLLAMLLGIFWHGWKCSSLSDHTLSLIGVALMAGIAGEAIHNMVEAFSGRHFWQIVATIFALLLIVRYKSPATDRPEDNRSARPQPLNISPPQLIES